MKMSNVAQQHTGNRPSDQRLVWQLSDLEWSNNNNNKKKKKKKMVLDVNRLLFVNVCV